MSAERQEDEPKVEPAPPSRWKRVGVWVERIVTLGLLAFVLYRVGPQLGALTGVGPDLGRAPTFSFVSLDGDTISSDALRGRVVVLNFWATWCGPCKLEMPSLQALSEDVDPNDVVVLGLATDAGGVEPIRAFLRERSITYPVGRATVAHRQAFGGIRGIPTTFLIDRDGVVRHRVVGYFAPPAMRVAVSRLVDEEGSAP
jgi:cytochrome c biogenesis protein CcmG, thiol:disulfide interchange protein DsbE